MGANETVSIRLNKPLYDAMMKRIQISGSTITRYLNAVLRKDLQSNDLTSVLLEERDRLVMALEKNREQLKVLGKEDYIYLDRQPMQRTLSGDDDGK